MATFSSMTAASFLRNCSARTLFERVEADAHHAEGGADGEGVLRDLVAWLMSASVETGRGQSWTPAAAVAGLDGVGVVEAGAAGGEQAEVAIHRCPG